MEQARKLEERIKQTAKPEYAHPEQIPPVIVHCSAGSGRTGTLIALYNLIEAIKFS